MRLTIFAFVLLLAPLSARVAAAVQPAPKPLRQLVYHFTYGDARNVTLHNSGFSGNGLGGAGGGSGVDNYTDNASATGSITVDVLAERPDKGLVLTVSESADNQQRNAAPATCIVYGIGTVNCDPQAKINPEEYSIIRLLGVGFVNPAIIDANNHWRLASTAPHVSTTSDYTITKNDGGVLTIDESRTVVPSGNGNSRIAVTNAIAYDLNREVVLSIDETTLDHPMVSGEDVDDRVEVTAHLQTDSMAPAH